MTAFRRARFMHRGGFTLIEALATIVILAALGAAASGILFNAIDGYLSARTTAQLHAELSIAMDRMVRELRSIPQDADAGAVAPDIDRVRSDSITWDDDYSLALTGSNVLLMIDGGASAVLLSDVTSFSVQAYDESDAALGQSLNNSACDAVRRIALTATVQRHGVSETLRTKLFLRSTMAGVEG